MGRGHDGDFYVGSKETWLLDDGTQKAAQLPSISQQRPVRRKGIYFEKKAPTRLGGVEARAASQQGDAKATVAGMATLTGIVFFGHQIGSFLGIWLAGYRYDTTGSYNGGFMISIGLRVFAALINLPVDQRPIAECRVAA